MKLSTKKFPTAFERGVVNRTINAVKNGKEVLYIGRAFGGGLTIGSTTLEDIDRHNKKEPEEFHIKQAYGLDIWNALHNELFIQEGEWNIKSRASLYYKLFFKNK